MYFVCVYPGRKTLLPKVVACEGPLIMMAGSLSKKKKKKKNKKKRGCSLIRACSLIRSNTVAVESWTLNQKSLGSKPLCSYLEAWLFFLSIHNAPVQ